MYIQMVLIPVKLHSTALLDIRVHTSTTTISRLRISFDEGVWRQAISKAHNALLRHFTTFHIFRPSFIQSSSKPTYILTPSSTCGVSILISHLNVINSAYFHSVEFKTNVHFNSFLDLWCIHPDIPLKRHQK